MDAFPDGARIDMLTLLTLDLRGIGDDRRCSGLGGVTGVIGASSRPGVGCIASEPQLLPAAGLSCALLGDTAFRSPRTFVSM